MTLASEAYHKGLEAAQGDAEEKSHSITNALGSIGKGIVVAGVAAVTLGIAELGAQIVDCVKDATAMDDAQAQLINNLGSTGYITGVTAEQVNNLAEQYSGLTKFSDLQITSAGAVMTRFKEISSTTFPDAMTAAMNLATVMGTDLPTAALSLSKMLEQPGTAMNKLRLAGVEVTPAMDKMLKSMVATGDVAGAQKYILDQLTNSIGGAAEAAGMTAAGQWQIFQNKLEQVRTKIGTAILPILQLLIGALLKVFDSPIVKNGIQFIVDLFDKLAAVFNLASQGGSDFAENLGMSFEIIGGKGSVFETIGKLILKFRDIFKAVVDHIKNDKGILVAVFAVIGTAIAIFAIQTVAAMLPVIISMLPLIIVIGLIAGAAYLLYHAWQNNWNGIHEKTAVVVAWLTEAFEKVKEWLAVAIPKALAWLANAWTTVLYPAIQKVWAFIQDPVFPTFVKIVDWLAVAIPKALAFLKTAWETVLLPAIKKVWAFIEDPLMPTLGKIVTWLGTIIKVAINTFVTDIWPKIKTAFDDAKKFIEDPLLPTLGKIIAWLSTIVRGAVTIFINDIWPKIKEAFDTVKKFIEDPLMPTLGKIIAWLSTIVSGVIDTFVNTIWPKIKTAFTTVKDFITNDLLGPTGAFTVIVSFLKTGFDDAVKAVQVAWGLILGAINTVKEVIQWLITNIKTALDLLSQLGGSGGAGGHWDSSGKWVPDTKTGNAAGGLATTSGWYHLAEQGPEMILTAPQTAAVLSGGGGTGTQTINIYAQPTTYKQGQLTMSEELQLYKWRYRF